MRRGGGAARPLARSAAAASDLARQLLRLLDVRLVERVDPEDGAGDRRRDLPAERSRAPRSIGSAMSIRITGCPAAAARRRARRGAVGRARAVARPRARGGRTRGPRRRPRSAPSGSRSTGTMPGAVLAGALGDELLDPRAEARDRRVGDERQLVAAVVGERPDREPERRPGFVAGSSARGRRRAIAWADARSGSRSSPIRLAGTSPT